MNAYIPYEQLFGVLIDYLVARAIVRMTVNSMNTRYSQFDVIVIGGGLTLYAIRAPSLKGGGLFAPVSREGALVLNNLLLPTAAAVVLLVDGNVVGHEWLYS